MFELGTFDGFTHTVVLASFLFGCWLVLIFLSFIWAIVWSWIDESDVEPGPLSMLLVKVFRLKPRRNWTNYKEYDNLIDRYLQISFALVIIPCSIWILLTFLNFTLIMATLVAVAYLSRFVRRLHKAFVKHTQDTNAHTDPKEKKG